MTAINKSCWWTYPESSYQKRQKRIFKLRLRIHLCNESVSHIQLTKNTCSRFVIPKKEIQFQNMRFFIFVLLCVSLAKASFLDSNRDVIVNPDGEDDCIGKLTLYSNTNGVYHTVSMHTSVRNVKHYRVIGLKVNGNCCWKIYKRRNFRGQSQTLYPGFESFLGGNNFRHVKSVKKIECWFAFLCKIKYLSENYAEHNQNVRMYPVLDYSIFPTTTKVRHEIHTFESFVLLCRLFRGQNHPKQWWFMRHHILQHEVWTVQVSFSNLFF